MKERGERLEDMEENISRTGLTIQSGCAASLLLNTLRHVCRSLFEFLSIIIVGAVITRLEDLSTNESQCLLLARIQLPRLEPSAREASLHLEAFLICAF